MTKGEKNVRTNVYVFCLGCLDLDMDVWIFGFFVENNGMTMLGCFIA